MSNVNTHYFNSGSLRKLYINELDDPAQAERLGREEHAWLRGLTRPSLNENPDPIRVDRLVLAAPRQPFELATALLLSHEYSSSQQVYLYGLSRGIEVFADRASLLMMLRTRFAGGNATTLFEAEKIEGDPFIAQMLAIVAHEVEAVVQLTEQLRLTPDLYRATTAAFAEQLHQTLPHMAVDPETHLLQVVRNTTDEIELSPVTQTLARASFDDYRQVQIEDGLQRRFLDALGRVASAADSVLFTQAFAATPARVPEHYARLLKTYWTDVWQDGCTRHDLAVETLASSWRRELYRCRHEGLLTSAAIGSLESVADEPNAQSAVCCSRLLIHIGYSNVYTLAGTFAVRLSVGSDRSLMWFSPEHRLARFADEAALAAYLDSPQGRQQIRPLLSFENQQVLHQQGTIQLDLEEIRTSVFIDRVDSIIALQARNLDYVVGWSDMPFEAVAMIDDALDIRQHLDPRQLQIHAGRWRRQAPFDFAEVWSTPASATSMAASSIEPSENDLPLPRSVSGKATKPRLIMAASWLETAEAFDTRANDLHGIGGTSALRDHAEQALQSYLCVLSAGTVHPGDVRVQWLESLPADPSEVESHSVAVSESQRFVSMDLVSLMLECLSGHRSSVPTTGVQVQLESGMSDGYLQIELITHMLDKVVESFIEHYIEGFKVSVLGSRRSADCTYRPFEQALGLREDAMRLDLSLQTRDGVLDSLSISMVRQVLDRPLRSLRMGLGALTDAFTVSLWCEDQSAVLCDTLVLRQAVNPAAGVMLWDSTSGWRRFDSIEQLQDTLLRELHYSRTERWLQKLSSGERLAIRRYLQRTHQANDVGDLVRVRLNRIDEHAVMSLQQGVLNRQLQDLRWLCAQASRCRLEAELITHLAASIERDGLLNDMIDELGLRIENSVFVAMMPTWLTGASLEELALYVRFFRRFYLASEGGEDFLFDIPSLQDFARQRLTGQLALDFPDQCFNPDQIIITSRHYVTGFPAVGELPSAVPAAVIARSESLTEYTINRFIGNQDAALSVDSETHPQAVHLLTPQYLRRLVRALDIGAGYMTVLRDAFAPGTAVWEKRKGLFFRQQPPALSALAVSERIKGNLSPKAYEMVSRVLETPDRIAREPIDGQRVILSPLQLVANRGLKPDTPTGIFLFCPADVTSGPIVLYAIFHTEFIFREYPGRAELMTAIRNDESLQRLVLERLGPHLHRRYANGGFTEPHLGSLVPRFDFDLPLHRPGPVALATTEITGNALESLFASSISVLLQKSDAQSVSNEKADRAEWGFLATLGLQQGLSLLPGKLGALVTLWQGETLFRASSDSVSGHRWGKALSEFSAALGVMVTAREQAVEDLPAEDKNGAGPVSGEPDGLPLAFSWRGISLNAEQRLRLQALEARDAVLEDMRHDDLLNLYLSKDNTPYAVVAGKVYQVKRIADRGQWIIVGSDGNTGPQLVMDSYQHWQLDLSLGLRGGGGVVTRFKTEMATTAGEETLIIEACGMPEIRTLYRQRARQIGQAHLQAKTYLENCLDNLSMNQRGTPPDARIAEVIGDFFGASPPDQALLSRVESTVRAVLLELMDPSLSPLSSPRFIVGTNRPGGDRATAFVMPMDPQKRVYLTERFFNPPLYRLTPEARAQGFEYPAHFQAATLIHELSHLALDTRDIAYLEANAPYPDYLRCGNASQVRRRSQLERLQDYRLSHRTLKSELFTVYEDGQWRDLRPKDRAGFATILQITGASTLNDARKVFHADLDKRSRVMLKNADSVTVLILRLGRHNYLPRIP